MSKQIEMHIHVNWDGPYTYSEVLKATQPQDYGVYQIYGCHPTYGSDVLLYIGKADAQTFGKRLSQHGWSEINQDGNSVRFYLGRLHGYSGTPDMDVWSQEITEVERLLIYSHWPAGNSSGRNVRFEEDYHHIHVLNWGKYRDLLPEVSGARYSNLYEAKMEFNPYMLDLEE